VRTADDGDDDGDGGGGGGGGGGASAASTADATNLLAPGDDDEDDEPTPPVNDGPNKLDAISLGYFKDGEEFIIVVVDEDGNPVAGASVTYDGITKISGPDGKVSFIAVAGVDDVIIEKEGYEPKDTELSRLEVEVPGKTVTEVPEETIVIEDGSDPIPFDLVLLVFVVVIAYLAFLFIFRKMR
jgi:hypothetical protein